MLLSFGFVSNICFCQYQMTSDSSDFLSSRSSFSQHLRHGYRCSRLLIVCWSFFTNKTQLKFIQSTKVSSASPSDSLNLSVWRAKWSPITRSDNLKVGKACLVSTIFKENKFDHVGLPFGTLKQINELSSVYWKCIQKKTFTYLEVSKRILLNVF